MALSALTLLVVQVIINLTKVLSSSSSSSSCYRIMSCILSNVSLFP